jgi:hypothetical protein
LKIKENKMHKKGIGVEQRVLVLCWIGEEIAKSNEFGLLLVGSRGAKHRCPTVYHGYGLFSFLDRLEKLPPT